MEQLQNQINDIREKNKIEVEYSKLNNRKIRFLYLLMGIVLTLQGVELELLVQIISKL